MACVVNYSATVRSTSRPGIFQLLFNGEDLDFTPLKQNKDVATVQKTLDAITGRNDIKIIDITWQGEWRYTYQPNPRDPYSPLNSDRIFAWRTTSVLVAFSSWEVSLLKLSLRSRN